MIGGSRVTNRRPRLLPPYFSKNTRRYYTVYGAVEPLVIGVTKVAAKTLGGKRSKRGMEKGRRE